MSKNEIKEIRSLSQKKYRERSGLFIVEGEKLVAEALESGFEVVKVLRMADIGFDAMKAITQLATPSPALAVVRQMPQEGLQTPLDGPILALDGIANPGNLGTIIRLAEWFGFGAVLLSEGCAELYNPKVVQATMGSLFRVRCIRGKLPEMLAKLGGEGYSLVGTFLDGENLYEAPLEGRSVIVMGSESDGISPEVAAVLDRRVTIPSFALGERGAESLNVALAAALVCSELRRRG